MLLRALITQGYWKVSSDANVFIFMHSNRWQQQSLFCIVPNSAHITSDMSPLTFWACNLLNRKPKVENIDKSVRRVMSFMVFHSNILWAGPRPSLAQSKQCWLKSRRRSSCWLLLPTCRGMKCVTRWIKMDWPARILRLLSHACTHTPSYTHFESILVSAINPYLDRWASWCE